MCHYKYSNSVCSCNHQGALATKTATATRASKQQVCRAKQRLCTCIALFCYISLPSLYDYDVKMPNFTFLWRAQTSHDELFSLFLNLSAVPKLSTPGKFACIRHFLQIGINATKFKKHEFILKVTFSLLSPSPMLKLLIIVTFSNRNIHILTLKHHFFSICHHTGNKQS